MSILSILKYPDPMLKKVCTPITSSDFDFDFELQTFLDNMIETMYADNGMGLSANQVGSLKRIFIMDESDERNQPIIFINPEIIYQSEEMSEDQEGCLSFPGVMLKLKRPKYINVRALDRHGKEFILERADYPARCMHHEMDHLNGIHFFDHISALKRELAEKKLQKYLHQTL
jgi:peptide deformylase